MKRLAWSLLSKLYSAYVDPKLKERVATKTLFQQNLLIYKRDHIQILLLILDESKRTN